MPVDRCTPAEDALELGAVVVPCACSCVPCACACVRWRVRACDGGSRRRRAGGGATWVRGSVMCVARDACVRDACGWRCRWPAAGGGALCRRLLLSWLEYASTREERRESGLWKALGRLPRLRPESVHVTEVQAGRAAIPHAGGRAGLPHGLPNLRIGLVEMRENRARILTRYTFNF